MNKNIGLAVVSAVLGLISIPLGAFVVGIIPAIISIILAVKSLKEKRAGRALAIVGLVASGLALLESAILIVTIISSFTNEQAGNAVMNFIRG